jgi:hypothetical protein
MHSIHWDPQQSGQTPLSVKCTDCGLKRDFRAAAGISFAASGKSKSTNFPHSLQMA